MCLSQNIPLTFFFLVSDKSVLVVINGIQKYWGNRPKGLNYNSITNIFPWLAFWTLLPLALQLCLMSGEIIQMSPEQNIISEALAILSRRLLSLSGGHSNHPSSVTWPCMWWYNSIDTRSHPRFREKLLMLLWPNKRTAEITFKVKKKKAPTLASTLLSLSICHYLAVMETVSV